MRKFAVGAAAVAVVGGMIAAASYAHADPSVKKLFEDCGNTDLVSSCKINDPVNLRKSVGQQQQVGNAAWNCSETGEVGKEVGGSTTTSTTTSLEATASVTAGFAQVFEASFSATFGQSWTREESKEEKTSITIGPREVGWLNHGPALQSTDVHIEVFYKDKVDDHFKWFTEGDQNRTTITGPDPSGRGNTVGYTRAMTADEIARICTDTGPDSDLIAARIVADEIVETNDIMGTVGEIVFEGGEKGDELIATTPSAVVGAD
jgi:hypothetical protein